MAALGIPMVGNEWAGHKAANEFFEEFTVIDIRECKAGASVRSIKRGGVAKIKRSIRESGFQVVPFLFYIVVIHPIC
jgi:hypothetical protein